MRKKMIIISIMAFVIMGVAASSQLRAEEFSGDLVISGSGSLLKAKLFVKDENIHRLEMPEEAGGLIFLRPPNARGKIWMIDPDKKQYRILSWPQKHKDPIEAWTDIQYDMSGGPVGDETINGHPCKVFQFKYEGSDDVALKIWQAEDLEYAIRRVADAKIAVELGADPQTVKGTFEILNIKKEELDEGLFQVPADYVEVK
jgi:hypothetical protein